ncbi:hypothetical protein CMI42_05120 [Candidatus Pacearchaeota archaeon]|nr:hypothetical protein [Candidatus Pacearchaeota archaeon]
MISLLPRAGEQIDSDCKWRVGGTKTTESIYELGGLKDLGMKSILVFKDLNHKLNTIITKNYLLI